MKTTAKRIIIGILANVALCINAQALTDALKVKVIKGTTSDETVIRFLPTATTGFDGSFDAYKMFSASPTVPAMFTDIDPVSHMSINALPSLTTNVSVELFIHVKVAGTYTLQSIELGAFHADATILLEDKETGNKYAFRNGTSITIPMTVNTVSSASRFVIHFGAGTPIIGTVSTRPTDALREMVINEPIEPKKSSLNAYQVDNQLMINLVAEDLSNTELYVFSATGQLIFKQDKSLGSLSKQVDITTPGLYIIRSIADGILLTKKLTIAF